MYNFPGSNKTRCGHYPQADSELELAVGDEVVLEEVEDGWLSGRIGQTEEVLPRIFAPNTSSNKLEQPSSMYVHMNAQHVLFTSNTLRYAMNIFILVHILYNEKILFHNITPYVTEFDKTWLRRTKLH